MRPPDDVHKVLARYAERFPASMLDMRGMSVRDYERLPDLMRLALARGSPITVDDLAKRPDAPDAASGKVL